MQSSTCHSGLGREGIGEPTERMGGAHMSPESGHESDFFQQVAAAISHSAVQSREGTGSALTHKHPITKRLKLNHWLSYSSVGWQLELGSATRFPPLLLGQLGVGWSEIASVRTRSLSPCPQHTGLGIFQQWRMSVRFWISSEKEREREDMDVPKVQSWPTDISSAFCWPKQDTGQPRLGRKRRSRKGTLQRAWVQEGAWVYGHS